MLDPRPAPRHLYSPLLQRLYVLHISRRQVNASFPFTPPVDRSPCAVLLRVSAITILATVAINAQTRDLSAFGCSSSCLPSNGWPDLPGSTWPAGRPRPQRKLFLHGLSRRTVCMLENQTCIMSTILTSTGLACHWLRPLSLPLTDWFSVLLDPAGHSGERKIFRRQLGRVSQSCFDFSHDQVSLSFPRIRYLAVYKARKQKGRHN